jgi:hypothetical protein
MLPINKYLKNGIKGKEKRKMKTTVVLICIVLLPMISAYYPPQEAHILFIALILLQFQIKKNIRKCVFTFTEKSC